MRRNPFLSKVSSSRPRTLVPLISFLLSGFMETYLKSEKKKKKQLQHTLTTSWQHRSTQLHCVYSSQGSGFFFPPLRTIELFPSLRVILSSSSYMLGKKHFSFALSLTTKLSFLRNTCEDSHLVSRNRGEGSSRLCNAATVFKVNDGQQSHVHPKSITLQHTGSLSTNSDIYCKVTL